MHVVRAAHIRCIRSVGKMHFHHSAGRYRIFYYAFEFRMKKKKIDPETEALIYVESQPFLWAKGT